MGEGVKSQKLPVGQICCDMVGGFFCAIERGAHH